MKKIIILILALATSYFAKAQDTIRVGHKFKNFKNLELGTKTDLIHNEAQGRFLAAIKKRITSIETINGKEVLKVVHEWNSPNPSWKGSFTYYCEPETLKPIEHIRVTERKGKETYRFSAKEIIPIDSVLGASNEDFKIALVEPTYNWEIDLETYSLLPLKEGKTFVMNFYHPGGTTAPNFYTLKVEGSEKIKLADGSEMDCWVIYTDYRGTQETRFWYTKKGQNFVKMRGTYNGMKISKTRLY